MPACSKKLDQYLDIAKENHSIKADRQLSIALGLTHGQVNNFRKGKALPSDETMVKIAQLAGIDPEKALHELAYSRCISRNEFEAANVWKKISSTAAATLLFGFVALSPTQSEAANITGTKAHTTSDQCILCKIIAWLKSAVQRGPMPQNA